MSGSAPGYRVGVDVGGTFTDLILVTPDGRVLLDKTPSTLDDQSRGVMTGMQQLADGQGLSLKDFLGRLDLFAHGTTTADNTMIEMDGAVTGLLVTEGHRDEIELRRGHKEQIWDPSAPPPTPIARRRQRIAIPERVDATGAILKELDEEAVRRGVRRLQALGCTSIAVVYLFSFLNAKHELRTAELIREEFPDVEHISLSHEVLPKAPEFERTSTTLVNAYNAPRLQRYISNLIERLRIEGYPGHMLVMQSTGGVMPPEYVAKRSVSLLQSGPTGGALGAAHLGSVIGHPNVVSVDMGGTSYDVCLIRDGKPFVSTDWNWRYRYYIGLPMVDVQSVGAGGGSIATVKAGSLQVGPESAGSTPGPCCYSRGGRRATVTDADAALGWLPTTGFAGGRMTLDVEASRDAIRRDVGEPLGMADAEAAWAIERMVHATMADAVRRVLASRGADPRELALMAFGGNGAVHAWAQADLLGIDTILLPRTAPAFSAYGLLVADLLVDLVRAYVAPLSTVDVTAAQRLFTQMHDEARKELAPAGVDISDAQVQFLATMCYPGQNFDMPVPWPVDPTSAAPRDVDLLALAESFHAAHESDRGFSFRRQEPLLRSLRLVATAPTPTPAVPTPTGTASPAEALLETRPAYFGNGWVDTPVYDGPALAVGSVVHGPALVQEPFTVCVVGPGQQLTLDRTGTYVLTREPSQS
jgi:N-methylhydantoinase A